MNYIKFYMQYKKYSDSIVPDIKSKLFDDNSKKIQNISSMQIRRIAAVSICFVIVLSAIFIVYYSDINSVNTTSEVTSRSTGLWQGSENSNTDVYYPEDYKPREGATKEEAEQTTLTTDKPVYIFDEIITFTVKPLYEDDVILFGEDCYVQYYDVNRNEWVRCPKEYMIKAIAGLTKGPFTRSFNLSERVDNIAVKYRLAYEISVNQYKVKLVSNDFLILWDNGQSTLTTDKTNYNTDEEIIFTIKAQNESDIINLGNVYVQYYDSDYRGWKRCEDKAPEKAQYTSAKGIMTASYKIYRIGAKAEKYRLCSTARINDIDVTLISNEFTID